MKKLLFSLAIAACTIMACGNAQAATISYMDSVPMQGTNFNQSVSLTLFDPSLGTLNSIKIELSATVNGNISIESLDALASTVTSTLSALIQVLRPDLSLLLSATPAVGFVDNLTAFDGAIDFAGTSGTQHLGVSNSTSSMVITPPPMSDLALFTGIGSIILPVKANATSNASGSGNLVTIFQTQAGADVKITYDYTPTNTSVPEPSTLGIWSMVAGLFAVGGIRNRRRNAKAAA